jgi:hypothetical protein
MEMNMSLKNILMAVAATAVLTMTGVSAASADPWHDRDGRRDRVEHRMDRRMVERDRVFETLRFHHVRYFGDPYFYGSHYVVRSHDRGGRVVLVEVDPYTGAFIGVLRV